MAKIKIPNQSNMKFFNIPIDLALQNQDEIKEEIQVNLHYQRMIKESDWAFQKIQGDIQSVVDLFELKYDSSNPENEIKDDTRTSTDPSLISIKKPFQDVLKYFNKPDLKAAETLLKTLYLDNKQELAALIKTTDFRAKVSVPPQYQEYFQWRLFRFVLTLYKGDKNLTLYAKANLDMADHYHTQAVNKSKEEKSDLEARKLYLKAAGHYAIASLSEPGELSKQAGIMCINTVNLLMGTDERSFADIQNAKPDHYAAVIDDVISTTINAENCDLLACFEHQLRSLFQSLKGEYERVRFLGRSSIPRVSLLEPEQRHGVMWDDLMRMR